MALNPCCCCGITLQTGSKIIAILQIIAAIIFLIVSLVGVVALAVTDNVKLDNETDTQRDHRKIAETQLLIATSLVLVGSIIALIFAAILWRGAKNKSARLCRIWLIISVILLVLMFISFIIDCVNARTGYVLQLIKSALSVIFDAYCIFVVFCFYKELKGEDPPA